MAAAGATDVTERQIAVRYRGVCVACGRPLPAGSTAWWDSQTKLLRCEACEACVAAESQAPRSADTRGATAAGASAQREFERRHKRREERIRSTHPHLGGLFLALSDDPQSTEAWASGAEGERKVGACLERLAVNGTVVLHDRRIPRSRANIDHIVVAPSGVWVVDAKRREGGQVATRAVGGCLHGDVRLYVGRRDCTRLVSAMDHQVEVVRRALGNDLADLPVRPVLCFVDTQWTVFARPFEIDGVVIARPRTLVRMIRRTGELTGQTVALAGQRLTLGLPPA